MRNTYTITTKRRGAPQTQTPFLFINTSDSDSDSDSFYLLLAKDLYTTNLTICCHNKTTGEPYQSLSGVGAQLDTCLAQRTS
jgi:hypothetical protein